MRALLLAVPALLALAPAAAARTDPELRAPTRIESVRAYELPGERVAVDVRVRHGTLSRRAVAVGHRHRLAHVSRVTVSGGGARGSSSAALLLTARGRSFTHTQRVVLRGVGGGRLRLVVRARDRVSAGGRTADRARDRAARTVAVRPLELLPRRPRPRCEGFPHRVPYGVRSTVAVVCMGHAVRVRVRRQPRRGRARVVRVSRGRALLALRPRTRFTGRDSVVIEARSPSGVTTQTLRLRVQQFAFRALGDSVTAGFGYLGGGQPMAQADLFNCIPPTPGNDRCSSNSPNGPSSTGSAPAFLSDFGLSNQIAWPAQFASRVSITADMYENRAVSGSTPEDWATGDLNGQLEEIVADSPNLTAMTLGANPLLDTFIEGGGVACHELTNPQLFHSCVQNQIDQVDLTERLQSVVETLLSAPANKVVVSQYHLTLPAIALAEGWTATQLQSLFAILNSNVASAVKGVDGYGERLFLMTPPRFDTGIAGSGSVSCPGQTFTVDGPSRQAQITQQTLQGQGPFCATSEYWVISTDFGIHPTSDGHAQFADALSAVAQAHDLVPPLP